MGGKGIINKYEMLVGEIRKISKKQKLEENEQVERDKAMLVASLSSNHSWKTYKYLHEGMDLDKDAVAMEAKSAFNEGWKNITEKDVEEVVCSKVDEYLLSTWFFYAIPNERRDYFKNLLEKMRKEYVDGIEPIEKKE
ncbi:MAG: hypothetical protein ACP5RT_01230 [Candidatus Micrarchaeia archaeon]